LRKRKLLIVLVSSSNSNVLNDKKIIMTNSSFEGWLSILSSYFLAIVMLWHGATWEAFLPFITGTGSLILMYGFAVRDWIISILICI